MSILDLIQEYINTLSERIDDLDDRVEKLYNSIEKKEKNCIKCQSKLNEKAIIVSKYEYEKIIAVLDRIAFNIQNK